MTLEDTYTDENTAWGGSGSTLDNIFKGVGTLGNAAGNIIGALKDRPDVEVVTPQQASQTSLKAYLPWILGGVGLVVVAIIGLSFLRRK